MFCSVTKCINFTTFSHQFVSPTLLHSAGLGAQLTSTLKTHEIVTSIYVVFYQFLFSKTARQLGIFVLSFSYHYYYSLIYEFTGVINKEAIIVGCYQNQPNICSILTHLIIQKRFIITGFLYTNVDYPKIEA